MPKNVKHREAKLVKSRKTNCVNVLISCGGREYGVWCMVQAVGGRNIIIAWGGWRGWVNLRLPSN